MIKESIMKFVIAVTAVVASLIAMGAGSASAAPFGLQEFGGATSLNGTMSRQAGEHADLTTHVSFPAEDIGGKTAMEEQPRTVRVDLPPGLTGNPENFAACTTAELTAGNQGKDPRCPIESQVGIARLKLSPDPSADTFPVPVYNMERPVDLPALFAFIYAGAVYRVQPEVRGSDFGISATVASISQAVTLTSTTLTLWGVPADPIHDPDRYDPDKNGFGGFGVSTSAPRRPFMTNPTSCSGAPSRFDGAADSWQNPGVFKPASFDRDLDGAPFIWTGCERLQFDPSITVHPGSRLADAPTGLSVNIDVPQNNSAGGLATAHVKNVKVVLPDGMSVSPSSAAGLGACSLAAIKLGSNEPPSCPESAKIGTVDIDTPLLDEPLTGDVILAAQDDNPFRTLLAMYIVARGPGVLVKLPARIDTDPNTGRVTTVVDNAPQLPFSAMELTFRGGSKAPLATPTACGRYSTHASITSWASSTPVEIETPMVIDEGCGPRPHAPSFSAGTINPLAGADSPFTFTLTRADRSQYLSRIDAMLPPGLLGRIVSAGRCAANLAAAGACPADALVGSTSVLSGPGETPLPMNGRVYLTGPYKDAPFGLSIIVPTAGQAGPFNLGDVVVRAGIYVDRTTAKVTVKSDPLPRIIQGIPLRLRQVTVRMDRPGFMVNPTSCDAQTIGTVVESVEGSSWATTVPFRVGGCRDLDLDQKLTLRLTGKKSTTDGTHPGILANLTSKSGDANLEKVTVKLPLSLALDSDNAQGLCTPTQRRALNCPKASIIGTATARSILPSELRGPVYFVEGVRTSKTTGRQIRTLPKLWIPLSGDGVTIDVNADSDVDNIDRLVTTFHTLPDAPLSSFKLNLSGGKHGVIVVSGKPSACERSRTADVEIEGHNGQTQEISPKLTIDGCKPKISKSTVSKRTLSVRVIGIGAGKLTVRGSGVKSRSRTIKSADAATIKAPLAEGARVALRRRGTAKVRFTVTFTPTKGRAVKMTKVVTARR